MDQAIFYSVQHHETMGILIAVYFFLSGLAAGAFLTAATCRIFGGGRYAGIEKTAAIASPVLLIPGLMCLVLDLGKPFRMLNLFFYFNPSSVASWGVWIINIFLGISLINAFLHFKGKAEGARPLSCIGGVFALAVALYSGMLLFQMHGHELWHSALVPVIFLASAVASGVAVVLLLSGSAESDQTRTLSSFLAGAIGVELVLALTEILTFAWSSGGKAEAAGAILSGRLGFMFIGVYLIAGLILPLIVLTRQRGSRFVQVAAAVLVLIGTLAMRYVIVVGGQVLPLS